MAAKVKPAEALSFGFYHFHPRWTVHYGEDIEKRYEEFEDVVKAGYTNCIIVEKSYLNDDEFWRIIFENDCTVWLNIYDYFDSSKEEYKEWSREFDKALNILRANPERWERFMGFHFDEPVWRGQSNEDFLTECKNLYEEYGKRIFPVFATGEFMDSEGNAMQIKMDAAKMKKVIPEALKYVTDVGFDSYSVDVRFGFGNGDFIERNHQKIPEIVDGKSYYEELTKLLVRIVGHDVNVWFFPCSYTTGLWRGGQVNEDYCAAHLDFFCELLMRQKCQGGIITYTYKNNASKPEELGLVSHIEVTDQDGNQKLFPERANWENYSECMKNAVKKFKETKAKTAKFNF